MSEVQETPLERAVLALTDRTTFDLARTYVAEGDVFVVSDQQEARARRIESVVPSAVAGKWYERVVVHLGEDNEEDIDLSCTCGKAPRCVHAAATVLASGPSMIPALAGHQRASEPPSIMVESSDTSGDWLDLEIKVSIDGEEVDFRELFTALSRGDSLFVLPSGTYFTLDTPELLQLRGIIAEATELNEASPSQLRLSKYQISLWQQMAGLGMVTVRDHQWWQSLRSITDTDQAPRYAVPKGLQAQLRDYQESGYRWLRFLYEHQLGAVLADEMGLGKTLQTIALMQAAAESGQLEQPFLILAPTSVVSNWALELQRFAPGLRVSVQTETLRRSGEKLEALAAENDVIITSYALFRLEETQYQQIQWAGLILDEAQMIKNQSSRGYRAARALRTGFTLVITGTPMENSLLELWALTSLACPGLLGARERFISAFQVPIEKEHNAERLQVLRRRLRPFLLRRTKEAVASELPPKQEQVLTLTLHPEHRRLYDRRLQRERQKLLGLVDGTPSSRFEIFRSLTMLRQLSLDSELAGEEPTASVKLETLGSLVTEAVAGGHRVLVLSQFTRFLRKARNTCEQLGVSSAYLDGATRSRQDEISSFREGDRQAFFISLKAGGFGLNLVEADCVILLDPWWNPAAEAQAIDRAHRIGQTRSVMVYRLVAEDTVESKVLALQEAKAELFSRVLENDDDEQAPTALSTADLQALLAGTD